MLHIDLASSSHANNFVSEPTWFTLLRANSNYDNDYDDNNNDNNNKNIIFLEETMRIRTATSVFSQSLYGKIWSCGFS